MGPEDDLGGRHGPADEMRIILRTVPAGDGVRTRLAGLRGRRGRQVTFPTVTTAQTLFSIALGSATLLITFFGLYVASSTMWGNRWFRRPR